ncbi:hypothetical protein WJX77_000573 [Trebouxia sp. C0004]
MNVHPDAVQDSPITLEAFKLHLDSTGEQDRRLYVIHAHTYFPHSTEADQEKAHKFQAAIKARFADERGVRIGTIDPQAGGPHPMPQFETSFTKFHLVDVLPWLMFNRPEEFSILVHPFTAKVVEDHDSSAVWLGKQLQCHLEPLQKFQQHVATEIKAGKDEAALLWPFA